MSGFAPRTSRRRGIQLALIGAMLLNAFAFDISAANETRKSCGCPLSRAESGPGLRLALEMLEPPQFSQADANEVSGSAFEPRSESQAFKYSLIGTLAPLPTIVLTLPGLIVGPSLGYFKSGLKSRAWLGIGIRTVGVGGVITSFAICGWDCGPGDDSYNLAWAVFLTSSVITVGSAIFDIATVKKAVRHLNSKLHQSPIIVVPVCSVRDRAAGLRIVVRI